MGTHKDQPIHSQPRPEGEPDRVRRPGPGIQAAAALREAGAGPEIVGPLQIDDRTDGNAAGRCTAVGAAWEPERTSRKEWRTAMLVAPDMFPLSRSTRHECSSCQLSRLSALRRTESQPVSQELRQWGSPGGSAEGAARSEGRRPGTREAGALCQAVEDRRPARVAQHRQLAQVEPHARLLEVFVEEPRDERPGGAFPAGGALAREYSASASAGVGSACGGKQNKTTQQGGSSVRASVRRRRAHRMHRRMCLGTAFPTKFSP